MQLSTPVANESPETAVYTNLFTDLVKVCVLLVVLVVLLGGALWCFCGPCWCCALGGGLSSWLGTAVTKQQLHTCGKATLDPSNTVPLHCHITPHHPAGRAE